MVTVISYDLFNEGNLNNIMEMNTTEYIHVSSKIRKLSIINLGMSEAELQAIKSVPASLNLFNKSFSHKVLGSLQSDCCILTSGSLNEDEFKVAVENIKPLVGKTKLVGIGVGKDVLVAASQGAAWSDAGDYMTLTEHNMVGFDQNIDDLALILA